MLMLIFIFIFCLTMRASEAAPRAATPTVCLRLCVDMTGGVDEDEDEDLLAGMPVASFSAFAALA